MPSDTPRKHQSSSSQSTSQKSQSFTSSSPTKSSKASKRNSLPEKTANGHTNHDDSAMDVDIFKSTVSTTYVGHELPFSKIRSIMMSTPETMRANEEGIFAMTKAAEAFIGLLAKGAYDRSKGKLIMYSNLADFVQDNDDLSHIHEMVPRKVRFSTVEHFVREAQNERKSVGSNFLSS